MNRILGAFAGCLGVATWIGASLLHLWTIILAYKVFGFLGAVVVAILPGIAEFIWAILSWQNYGFWNPYTLACAAIIAVFSIISLIAKLTEKDDEKKEEAEL